MIIVREQGSEFNNDGNEKYGCGNKAFGMVRNGLVPYKWAGSDYLGEEVNRAIIDAVFADCDIEITRFDSDHWNLDRIFEGVFWYGYPDIDVTGSHVVCCPTFDGSKSHDVVHDGEEEVHVIRGDLKNDADYFHDEVLKVAKRLGMDSTIDAYFAGVPVDYLIVDGD